MLNAAGILTIFYLVYQVFLKQETFFIVNRHFLMIGVFAAITMPFIRITDYVEVPLRSFDSVKAASATTIMTGANQQIDWIDLIFALYLLGSIILLVHFIIQLISLHHIKRKSDTKKIGRFSHVETDGNIAPFSFFNHIFYNPSRYSANELKAIIKHEEAHGSQWHTADVLLIHLVAIFTWINPFSWFYRNTIKQNLEFLADENAITRGEQSIKKYQYTLLKVSGNKFATPIVNHLYSSLIKKRIVMLNKSKSNNRSILKTVLIVPILAVFLLSFNTKKIYVPSKALSTSMESNDPSKIIEIIIDKNTTDKELEEIKSDLAKKKVDFSYTVVHNTKKEIIEISIEFSTQKDNGEKTRSASSFNNGDEPIDPIHIIYNEENNSISMSSGTEKSHRLHIDDEQTVWISSGDDKVRKTVKIINKNGKETITVNGKEVNREAYEKMKEEDGKHGTHIKIRKSMDGDDSNVFIMSDTHEESDSDLHVISEDGKGYFYSKGDDGEEPIIIIDGKESDKEDMNALNQNEIESINVTKGKNAIKKYGDRGKSGVVEITTKKD
jgi:urease beta subunit